MHQRNRYRTPPNFGHLAVAYPALAKFLLTNGTVNFRDPNAVRTLNKALLSVDFDLNVELPEQRLCPTIANRSPPPSSLDYLLFIEDLLQLTGALTDSTSIRGLDIGVGASCVYPLLACRLHPNWSFVGTEIDPESLEVARRNVAANGLNGRIRLLKVSDTEGLLENPLERLTPESPLHFCICNPPFYASPEEIQTRRGAKATDCDHEPFDYSARESVYPGGETAFVGRIIEESLRLKERVVWYSSLVGVKSNLINLEARLRQAHVPTIRVFPSLVGRTKRWILAWSFLPEPQLRRKRRRGEAISPRDGGSFNLGLPLGGLAGQSPREWLHTALTGLDLTRIGEGPTTTYRAHRVTWSRRARRNPKDHQINMTIQCSLRPDNVIDFSCLDNDASHWTHLESLVNHLRRNLDPQPTKHTCSFTKTI